MAKPTQDQITSLKEINNLPAHVGIIMDGNGRWAAKKGLPRVFGHRAGINRLREIIRLSSDLGIQALSLYAFSTENWKRPQEEINALCALFIEYFEREMDELHQNNVRIRALGDVSFFPKAIYNAVLAAEEKTKNNTGLQLNIALNYGSRIELLRAAQRYAKDCVEGKRDCETLDADTFEQYLYTDGLPQLDLVIRTGGEKRLSNFLLYQAAYAELMFLDTYWPDFTDVCYLAALQEFGNRSRRYGGL